MNVYSKECEFGNYIFKVDKQEVILFDKSYWNRILYLMNKNREILFTIPISDEFSKIFSTLLYVDYSHYIEMMEEEVELDLENFIVGTVSFEDFMTFEFLDLMYPEINNVFDISMISDSYYSFGHVVFHINVFDKLYSILFTSHNQSSYLAIQEYKNDIVVMDITLTPTDVFELFDLSMVINDDLIDDMINACQNNL